MAKPQAKYKVAASNELKDTTPIQSISDMLSKFRWHRDEFTRRQRLRMDFKVNEGTATFKDQIQFTENQMKWWDKFSSSYAQLRNEKQALEEQEEETEIQFKYKTRQISDEELLEIRQNQLAETTDGSAKNFDLRTEIDDIERRITLRDDQQEMEQSVLAYKNNFASADEHLLFLEDRLTAMNTDPQRYTVDEIFQAEQNVQQQQIVVDDLAQEAQALQDDIAFKNGVDQVAAAQAYVTQLNNRLDSERDPLERIRIQGQIDAQTEYLRGLERDRDEMQFRIDYADRSITKEEFLANLNELAQAEINPDKKLEYQLEVARVGREVTESTFQDEAQSLENQFNRDQNRQAYLDGLLALKEKYKNDEEISFQLDGIIAREERVAKNENYQNDLQKIENSFQSHKDKGKYLQELQGLVDIYGDDLLLGFKLGSVIARAKGDTDAEQFNLALENIANQYNRKEITGDEYIAAVNGLRTKPEFATFINSPTFQSELERISAQVVGNVKTEAFGVEIQRLADLHNNHSLTDDQYLSELNKMKGSPQFKDLMRLTSFSSQLDGLIARMEGTIDDNQFNDKLNGLKNEFNSRKITQEEYLTGLNSLREEHQDNPNYLNVLNGSIAQLEGDEITTQFSNRLSDMKQKYDSGDWDDVQYLNSLRTEQAKYSSTGPNADFNRQLGGLVASMETTVRNNKFDTQISELENTYRRNPTTEGLQNYITGLQGLKSQYIGYDDIITTIESKEAMATGNETEALYKSELANMQRKLSEGRYESPNNDFGTSTYLQDLELLKSKYFGEGMENTPGQSALNALDAELRGDEGTVTRNQLSRKLQGLNDEWSSGKIDDNVYRSELLRLKGLNSFGSSLDVKQLFDEDIYRVEVDLAQQSYQDYTKEFETGRQERISEQQRRFSRQEQSFRDVQARYGADQASFEEYEGARTRLAESTKIYEDWKTKIQTPDYEAPEFDFKTFRPESREIKPKFKLPELFEF